MRAIKVGHIFQIFGKITFFVSKKNRLVFALNFSHNSRWREFFSSSSSIFTFKGKKIEILFQFFLVFLMSPLHDGPQRQYEFFLSLDGLMDKKSSIFWPILSQSSSVFFVSR